MRSPARARSRALILLLAALVAATQWLSLGHSIDHREPDPGGGLVAGSVGAVAGANDRVAASDSAVAAVDGLAHSSPGSEPGHRPGDATCLALAHLQTVAPLAASLPTFDRHTGIDEATAREAHGPALARPWPPALPRAPPTRPLSAS